MDGSPKAAPAYFGATPSWHTVLVDTTGAGDIFHGSVGYGLLPGWKVDRIPEFSNPHAALKFTKLGARGGIATRKEAEMLMAKGVRHCNPDFENSPRVTGQARRPKDRKRGERT